MTEQFSASDPSRDFRNLQDWIRAECRQLAGPHMDEMLKGAARAAPYLLDSDPKLRQAAVRMFTFFRKERDSYLATFEHLMLEDADLEVRLHALDAWVTSYSKSNDPRVTRRLAEFVSDPALDKRFRQRAYLGLFIVRGASIDAWPPPIPSAIGQFEETIDWPFVNEAIDSDPKQ